MNTDMKQFNDKSGPLILVADDDRIEHAERIRDQIRSIGYEVQVMRSSDVTPEHVDEQSLLDLSEIPVAALEHFDVDVKSTRKALRKERMKELQRKAIVGKK